MFITPCSHLYLRALICDRFHPFLRNYTNKTNINLWIPTESILNVNKCFVDALIMNASHLIIRLANIKHYKPYINYEYCYLDILLGIPDRVSLRSSMEGMLYVTDYTVIIIRYIKKKKINIYITLLH